MLWEVAVLLVAITFMVVNMWSIILNTMVLKKFAPYMDRMMKVCGKMMEQMEEAFEDEDEK